MGKTWRITRTKKTADKEVLALRKKGYSAHTKKLGVSEKNKLPMSLQNYRYRVIKGKKN